MKDAWKHLGAELLGTFVIVATPVMAAAAGLASGRDSGLVVGALSSGLPVTAAIAAFGPISRAHFNPAVTIAFAAVGRFPWRRVPGYVAAQLLGGILAAAVVAFLIAPGPGSHVPAQPEQVVRNLGVEVLITFLLMLSVMGVATDKRIHPLAPPVVIGLMVCALVMAGNPVTGASMNPARTLGPNLFAGGAAVQWLWLYIVGTVAGALLAAFAFEWVRASPQDGANPDPDA